MKKEDNTIELSLEALEDVSGGARQRLFRPSPGPNRPRKGSSNGPK